MIRPSGGGRSSQTADVITIDNPSRHVILSGCSGGGKSTLIAELAGRGFGTVSEPGRRIVAEELRGDGKALPWVNLAAFAKRTIQVAAQDRSLVNTLGYWTFFDRGLVDAAVALQHATGHAASSTVASFPRYHQRVFFTPPWPEIFRKDQERQHNIDEAIVEYERLVAAYRELGYDPVILPRSTVGERVRFVLSQLE